MTKKKEAQFEDAAHNRVYPSRHGDWCGRVRRSWDAYETFREEFEADLKGESPCDPTVEVPQEIAFAI